MSWLEIGLSLLAAGLAVALYRNLREFRKLRRWASQPRLSDPPEAEGAWGEVFNLLHRHRRAMLKRRRELAQLMVRSRRGAQALPYGVAVLDADYRLDWCNDAAQEHLGVDPERDRKQPLVNMVRAPEFVEYLRAADFSEPLRLGSPGGGRTLSVQIVSFGDEDHLLLSQDVTGAARVEAMRRDFVANVSHELRTPLTVLAGFLETIQDLKLDASRVRDYVGLMAPQAERMRHLIDDLLTLSVLEHAPAPPDAERVALRPLLRGCAPRRKRCPPASTASRSRQRAGTTCWAPRARSPAPSSTWCPTRCATRRPAAKSACAGIRPAAARSFPSRTPASASTPNTCRASPSASTAWTGAARARRAAPASACRSSSTRSRGTRACC